MTELEDVIDEIYDRALKTIDDGLYELLGKNPDETCPDEFYMDYKEAFTDIVNRLQQDINPTD